MTNGVVYLRTLLLLRSPTQRLPPESKATPAGKCSPVEVVAAPPVVKLDWPITRFAAWPVENANATGAKSSNTTKKMPRRAPLTAKKVLEPLL